MDLFRTAGLAGGIVLLVWVEPAATDPWDSSCRSQIDNVESAAQAALHAQQEVTDAYEEYEQKREDLRSCLLFPDVYDLMQDGCRSRRWDAQTARDELNSALDTFYGHVRTLIGGVNSVTALCR